MSGSELNLRRQARLLTDEDLKAIRQLIEAIAGNGDDGRPAILLQDLTFHEATGGIAAGTTFPLGTPHDEIFRRMAKAPVVYPVYKAPTLSLATSVPSNPEIGSLLSLTFTPTWNRNDAGAPLSYTLKKSGLNMFTAEMPAVYKEPTFTLSGTTISYQAVVTFSAGAVKNDSEGHPYPTGMIQAGTVSSSTISCAGVRYGFYGADTAQEPPARSSEIRDLPSRLPNARNGVSFTLSVPVGARRVSFWYPNTCRDVSSVSYVEQGNAEYKDLFLKSSADVEGANGFAVAPYKGYTWLPAVAVSAPMTLNVLI